MESLSTARRSPHAPDLPTMTEAGVLGLEIDGWVGLFAPAKTPPNAIARLQREIANAMPELKPRFEAAGGEPMDVPPERLKSYLQADYDSGSRSSAKPSALNDRHARSRRVPASGRNAFCSGVKPWPECGNSIPFAVRASRGPRTARFRPRRRGPFLQRLAMRTP